MDNRGLSNARVRVTPDMRAALAGATVAIAIFVAGIRLLPGGEPAVRLFENGYLLTAALATTAAFAWAAAGLSGRLRWAWALGAAGLLAWSCGQVLSAGHVLAALSPAPVTTAAGLLQLAEAPLFTVAVILLPAPRRPALLLRGLVDGLIIGAALVWILWLLAGAEVFALAHGSPAAAAVRLAHPIADVVVLAAAAYAAAYSPVPVRSVVLLLVAGLACKAVADTAMVYRAATGSYHAGMRLDILWAAGLVLASAAAVLARRRAWPRPLADSRPAWADAVVLSFLLAGAASSAWYRESTPLSGLFYWDALAAGGLLVARQLLSALDSRALERDRVAAVEALRASEGSLQQLIDHAPVTLFSITADGTIQMARGHAIPGVENSVGHNVHRFPTHPVLTLIGPALRGEETIGTISVRGRTVEMRCSPVWIEGRPAGVVGVVIDVTDRFEAEAARRASEAKDRFLASMSHELRTPLNSILGFAQMLEVDGASPLSDRQQRYRDHIVASGRHLLGLINDVLDMARVNAGRLQVEAAPVDLAEIASGVVAMIQPQARAAGVSVGMGRVEPLVVVADEGRVRQVLLNLLANAVRFTPAGGWVRVITRVAGGAVRLEVVDSGIGIAAADQERIFEEFTQLDSGRSRSGDGAGLGLALSRALMRRMGGDLTVASAEGTGSTFTIELPMAPVDEPAGEVVDAAEAVS